MIPAATALAGTSGRSVPENASATRYVSHVDTSSPTRNAVARRWSRVWDAKNGRLMASPNATISTR
jgi:hypothetical protein